MKLGRFALLRRGKFVEEGTKLCLDNMALITGGHFFGRSRSFHHVPVQNSRATPCYLAAGKAWGSWNRRGGLRGDDRDWPTQSPRIYWVTHLFPFRNVSLHPEAHYIKVLSATFFNGSRQMHEQYLKSFHRCFFHFLNFFHLMSFQINYKLIILPFSSIIWQSNVSLNKT
jgi:hypothetical protein